MKFRENFFPLCIFIIAFATFVLTFDKNMRFNTTTLDRVVVSAPIQIILSGGDPFLAANFETIRVSATWDGTPESNSIDAQFRLRTHSVIAQLNPCHEDNYYQANAVLAWSGAPAEGNLILKKAMNCRTWDDIPAFFYGFNNHYFFNNHTEAERALSIATSRAPEKVSYKRLVISLKANLLPNDEEALRFLRNQRNHTSDPQLKKMLTRSILRLEALIQLKEAQKRYELQFKQPLIDPFDLLNTHIITKFPSDPLGIGFEFDNGKFQFRELKLN